MRHKAEKLSVFQQQVKIVRRKTTSVLEAFVEIGKIKKDFSTRQLCVKQ